MQNHDIARPHPDLVARLGRLATSTLANALDEFRLHANVLGDIHALAPGLRFSGPALTVRESTAELGGFPPSDFRVGAMIDAAAPGDVIVVAAGGVAYSTWGGMASLAATVKGVAGLVVKLQGCQLNHDIAALAIDVMGELGTLYHGSRYERAKGMWQFQHMFSLGLIIGGGTAQIQKNIISERGLGMPREPKPARV